MQTNARKDKKNVSHLYKEARGDSIVWQDQACM